MYSDVETTSVEERQRSSSKKTNKPMMEKKRRARINHSLSELKEMLIMDKHASAGHAKWEKADILEMTVDYLKKLRSSKGLAPLPMSSFPISDDVDDSCSLTEAKSSRHVSPAPSSSSNESSDPPSAKKRRISIPLPQNPPNLPTTSALPIPSPVIAHPSPVMPPQINPGINFMAQQLFAIHNYHQHMKMASTPPGFLHTTSLPTPIPIHMASMPWRPI